MAATVTWKDVKSFVTTDLRYAQILTEIGFLQNQIDALEQAPQALEKHQSELTKIVNEKKKLVHEAELAYATINQHIKKKQLALEQVVSTREQTALEHEYEDLAKKLSAAEEVFFKLTDELETAENKLATFSHNAALEKPNIETEISIRRSKIAELESQVSELRAATDTLSSTIDAAWMATFKKLKTAYFNPVVKVTEKLCSGCSYPLTPQDLVNTRKGLMIPCKGCFRLVYLDEEAA